MREIRPNFLIVGAAKSGTTSVVHYMAEHPDIFISPIKEPCFFTDVKPVSEHVNTWEEYLALFEGAVKYKWRGEASTPYLYYYKEVIPKIRNRMADCKILIFLRHPAERVYSMYCHNRKDLREPLEFGAALEVEDSRVADKWLTEFHYRRLGFVADAVKSYVDAFGPHNTGVFFYDDMISSLDVFMAQIYAFLDVPVLNVAKPVAHNISGIPKNPCLYALLQRKAIWKEPIKALLPAGVRSRVKQRILDANLEKTPMPAPVRQKLVALYRADTENLEKMTGRDLSAWKR